MAIEPDRNQPDHYGTWPAECTDPDLENLRNLHVGTGLVLRDTNVKADAVDGDRLLSKEGKDKAKAALVPAAEERLNRNETVVKIHEEKVAALEAEVSGAKLFKSDSPAVAVRMAEIRTWLAKWDRERLFATLHDAVREQDPDSMELIAAAVTAPAFMGLIPAEIRKALIDAVAERRFPEKIAELNQRRKAVEVARFGINRAREILRSKYLPQGDIRARFIVGDGK